MMNIKFLITCYYFAVDEVAGDAYYGYSYNGLELRPLCTFKKNMYIEVLFPHNLHMYSGS